jgi:hypothetical protein
VIGNSHVAALKKSSFQLNCNTLDYYAIPGAGAPDLLLKTVDSSQIMTQIKESPILTLNLVNGLAVIFRRSKYRAWS